MARFRYPAPARCLFAAFSVRPLTIAHPIQSYSASSVAFAVAAATPDCRPVRPCTETSDTISLYFDRPHGKPSLLSGCAGPRRVNRLRAIPDWIPVADRDGIVRAVRNEPAYGATGAAGIAGNGTGVAAKTRGHPGGIQFAVRWL